MLNLEPCWTRVSKEVNTAVLKDGKSCYDRAFLINDLYITIYSDPTPCPSLPHAA
jgi:hypothetical protein